MVNGIGLFQQPASLVVAVIFVFEIEQRSPLKAKTGSKTVVTKPSGISTSVKPSLGP
jgi:hypothetical protein